MKFSLGIDAIDINRFEHWSDKSNASLARIFAPYEITYCKQIPAKCAERFAVRFAAKEAFYKALCMFLKQPVSLLHVVRLVSVSHASGGIPLLEINWTELNMKPLTATLTITHTKNTAIACVLLHDN